MFSPQTTFFFYCNFSKYSPSTLTHLPTVFLPTAEKPVWTRSWMLVKDTGKWLIRGMIFSWIFSQQDITCGVGRRKATVETQGQWSGKGERPRFNVLFGEIHLHEVTLVNEFDTTRASVRTLFFKIDWSQQAQTIVFNNNNKKKENGNLYSGFGNSKRFTITLKCGRRRRRRRRRRSNTAREKSMP